MLHSNSKKPQKPNFSNILVYINVSFGNVDLRNNFEWPPYWLFSSLLFPTKGTKGRKSLFWLIVWGRPIMMWGRGGRGGSSYGSRNLMIGTGLVLSLVRTQRRTHWAPPFPLFIHSQTPEHEMMTHDGLPSWSKRLWKHPDEQAQSWVF